MNAVEEIQAAIGVLELLRSQPQPPYFDRWNGEDFSDGNLDDAVEEGFGYGQAYGEWKASRHLLEAQIGVLTRAYNMAVTRREVVTVVEMNLARAINGATS